MMNNPLVQCQRNKVCDGSINSATYIRCFLQEVLLEHHQEGESLVRCLKTWLVDDPFLDGTRKEHGYSLISLYTMYFERVCAELCHGKWEVCVRAMERMKKTKHDIRDFVGKLLKLRFGKTPPVHQTYYWTPRNGRIPMPSEILPTARTKPPKEPVRIPSSFAFPVLTRPASGW